MRWAAERSDRQKEGDVASERVAGWVEFLGIAEETIAPGHIRCRLTMDARHRNIQGVVHGAVPVALMDTAMGHAMDSLLAEDQFCSTTQLSIQFMKAAAPGDVLEAEGRVTKRGRRIAYLDGVCRNEADDVIARAQGAWYIGTKRNAPA